MSRNVSTETGWSNKENKKAKKKGGKGEGGARACCTHETEEEGHAIMPSMSPLLPCLSMPTPPFKGPPTLLTSTCISHAEKQPWSSGANLPWLCISLMLFVVILHYKIITSKAKKCKVKASLRPWDAENSKRRKVSHNDDLNHVHIAHKWTVCIELQHSKGDKAVTDAWRNKERKNQYFPRSNLVDGSRPGKFEWADLRPDSLLQCMLPSRRNLSHNYWLYLAISPARKESNSC